MHNLRAFIIFSLLLTAVSAQAADTQQQAVDQEKILRVGGDYVVASIDQEERGDFKVVFKADKPTGHYDTLVLESDHVHVAVKVGQKIRLSAEILSDKGAVAEVAQVVIFFEGQAGRVPVWMLSTKATNLDLRATKYLEMHAPANDFMVM